MDRNEKIRAILLFLKFEVSQAKGHMYDLYSEPTLNHIFEDVESDDDFAQHHFTVAEMRFDTSWDWLVPVLQELKLSGMDEDRGHEAFDRLDNCLMELDLEATFDCALDIINDINGD